MISEKLSEENIKADKISVSVNISEPDSISINEIRLVFPEEVDIKDRVEQIVRSEVGASIPIIIVQNAHNTEPGDVADG
jgi:hypothetical protein